MKWLIYAFIVFAFCPNIYSQQKTSAGSLVQININEGNMDNAQVVAGWTTTQNQNFYESVDYDKIFSVEGKQYFVKRNSSYPVSAYYYRDSFQTSLVEIQSGGETLLFGGFYPECGLGSYLSGAANVVPSGDGVLINNNLSYTTYFFASGKLSNLCSDPLGMKIIHVAGKMGAGYLVAATDSTGYPIKYYIENFDGNIIPAFKKEIRFEGVELSEVTAPRRTWKINDTLSVINFEYMSNPMLSKSIGDSVVYLDTTNVGDGYFHAFKNGTLFYAESRQLFKRKFNLTGMSFGQEEIVMKVGNLYASDINEEYFTTIAEDTLYIYSMSEERMINKFSVGSITGCTALLIDSPYVYLKKLDKETSVYDAFDIPDEFVLEQNYPNPFNPETRIKYSIPSKVVETPHGASLRMVTLKIYDVLGREIATLVNGEKTPGNYEVEFDGKNLASGIYFYCLTAGEFMQTCKMLLLR